MGVGQHRVQRSPVAGVAQVQHAALLACVEAARVVAAERIARQRAHAVAGRDSTLTTSAPKSARYCAAVGPAMN